MNLPPDPAARPLTLRIDTLSIRAGSAVEARRLAQALPAALQQALAGWPVPPVPSHAAGRPLAQARAERVANELVRALLAKQAGEVP